MKKTILHFIYNLGRGGAEMVMVNSIRELKENKNIVVTLYPEDHFGDELECDAYYCLNLSSILLFPQAAIKLRRIIKENNVDLVHTHLFWPTIIARMGTPAKIPLVTTIHAFIASSVEYKQWHVKMLDKLTYKFRKSVMLADARGALDEYFSFLGLKPYKAYPLYTFVDIRKFKKPIEKSPKSAYETFKLVSVSALRVQKNITFLIDAFRGLRHENIQLDIYGTGPLVNDLQALITKNNVNVNLKGEVRNIQDIIGEYDVFVMSSTYEGFSLSVLEAMAMGMPLLLSDIASFREQCEDTAVYFNLSSEEDFIVKLKELQHDQHKLLDMGNRAYERVVNNYTLEKHMQQLRKIYSEFI